jgi:hypothetical protein
MNDNWADAMLNTMKSSFFIYTITCLFGKRDDVDNNGYKFAGCLWRGKI